MPRNKKSRPRLLEEKTAKYSGEKFNSLTIQNFTKYKGKGQAYCNAMCECGTVIEVLFVSITSGNTKSCGCLKRTNIWELIKETTSLYVGKKFGKVTVKEILGYGKEHNVRCIGLCDCGVEKQFNLHPLRNGKTKSCGCLKIGSKPIHGLLKHPLYGRWSGIKQRCYNPKVPSYKWYGAKGIKMCSKWKSNFVEFYNWAIANGWEKGLQFDRFPNKSGNYSPSNCRIVSALVNCNNKDNNIIIGIEGSNHTITEISEKYNVERKRLYKRINRGWSIKEALETPIQTQFNRYKK